ncbi:MAG TPA: hypothetical protein VFQ50_09990 [Flavobacterium sp.]|nr:hypothetical protein [Flavobacterium sp.]
MEAETPQRIPVVFRGDVRRPPGAATTAFENKGRGEELPRTAGTSFI